MVENVKKEIDRIKGDKKGRCVGMGINNIPLNFYKKFTSKAKMEYGDLYYPLLQDLWRKAEAYDWIVSYQQMPLLDVENGVHDGYVDDITDKEDDDYQEVKTFGDVMKLKKR